MKVNIYDFNDELVSVERFQLLQWKHAIGLEMKGLTHSRGSVTAHVRKLLKAPNSYQREQLFNHLSDSLKDIDRQLSGIDPLNLTEAD